MKKQYIKPALEISEIDSDDILGFDTVSGGGSILNKNDETETDITVNVNPLDPNNPGGIAPAKALSFYDNVLWED